MMNYLIDTYNRLKNCIIQSSSGMLSMITLFYLSIGCKEKYIPQIHKPSLGFLVVEGFINAGDDSTFFSLSRATGIDSIAIIPETDAILDIQSEDGSDYPLIEQNNGKYATARPPVRTDLKYRLHIRTLNGNEYVSEYTSVMETPAIDSVTWKAESDDVVVYVNTHGNENGTGYYRWTYEETWKYKSPLISEYVFEDDSVQRRPVNKLLPPLCWRSNASTGIILGSTSKLNQNVIFEFPVRKIFYSESDRLNIEYSILVKQFVLSKEEYEWAQRIQKNTEQMGSIFDAQPSETGGNIHSVSDPGEKVVGFVGCSSETEKRLFIIKDELPANIGLYGDYSYCYKLEIVNDPDSLRSQLVNDIQLITGVKMGLHRPVDAVFISPAECADCRMEGGTEIKPSFWR